MTLSSQAAPAYWDADGTTNGTYGGTGTWNSTNTNWAPDTTGTGADAAWLTGDTAAFLRGTTADVTVGSGLSAAVLSFGLSTGTFTTGTGNFTLSGSDLTLTSTGKAILVDSDASVTLNNRILIGANMQVDLLGGGSINLAGGLRATASATTIFLGDATSVFDIGDLTKTAGTFTIQFGGTSGNAAARYNLNGNNTGIGNTNINKGTVVANSNGAFGSSGTINLGGISAVADSQTLLIGTAGVTIARNVSLNSGTNATGDTRVIGSNITSGTATYSGTVTLAETNASLRADAGGTTVFSGVVTDGAETRGITKTGAGVVKLTNANTYDGNTTVSVGTLLANNSTGSGTGTGTILVSSGATLGGTGVVAGAVTLAAGGRFSAGDMTDGVSNADSFEGSSFTLNSNNSTASMLFDLGTTSDLLTLSGAFTKGTGTDFIFNFEDAGGLALDTYTLVNFASTDFLLADLDYTSSISGLTGTFIVNSTSLQFQVTAVPEPSTYAMLGLGVGALWLLRRKDR